MGDILFVMLAVFLIFMSGGSLAYYSSIEFLIRSKQIDKIKFFMIINMTTTLIVAITLLVLGLYW